MFNKKINQRMNHLNEVLMKDSTVIQFLQIQMVNLKKRVWESECEQFIPASFTVEQHLPTDGWQVVKTHPILGKAFSQLFPTKGCAQKCLDEHFNQLQFTSFPNRELQNDLAKLNGRMAALANGMYTRAS